MERQGIFIFARALAGPGAPSLAAGYSDAGKLGVVTADDITEALVKIDHSAAQLQVAIDACPKLDPATVAQWNAWKDGYTQFSAANKNHGYFALGLPAIGDETISYEDDLKNWYRAISSAIKASGCGVTVGPSPETHDDASSQGSNTIADTLTAAAWVLGIGGVLYFGARYLPR